MLNYLFWFLTFEIFVTVEEQFKINKNSNFENIYVDIKNEIMFYIIELLDVSNFINFLQQIVWKDCKIKNLEDLVEIMYDNYVYKIKIDNEEYDVNLTLLTLIKNAVDFWMLISKEELNNFSNINSSEFKLLFNYLNLKKIKENLKNNIKKINTLLQNKWINVNYQINEDIFWDNTDLLLIKAENKKVNDILKKIILLNKVSSEIKELLTWWIFSYILSKEKKENKINEINNIFNNKIIEIIKKWNNETVDEIMEDVKKRVSKINFKKVWILMTIIWSVFTVLWSWISNADYISFDASQNSYITDDKYHWIEKLNKQMLEFSKKYWLKLDIVVWNKYNVDNIKKKLSDSDIVLFVDFKNHWIETFANKNLKPYLSYFDLDWCQSDTKSEFRNHDFYEWLQDYISCSTNVVQNKIDWIKKELVNSWLVSKEDLKEIQSWKLSFRKLLKIQKKYEKVIEAKNKKKIAESMKKILKYISYLLWILFWMMMLSYWSQAIIKKISEFNLNRDIKNYWEYIAKVELILTKIKEMYNNWNDISLFQKELDNYAKELDNLKIDLLNLWNKVRFNKYLSLYDKLTFNWTKWYKEEYKENKKDLLEIIEKIKNIEKEANELPETYIKKIDNLEKKLDWLNWIFN